MCLAHLRAFIQQTQITKVRPRLDSYKHSEKPLDYHLILNGCKSPLTSLCKIPRTDYHTSLTQKRPMVEELLILYLKVYLTWFDLWTHVTFHHTISWRSIYMYVGHLLAKFGYKQAYGWKVINHNRVLQVNFYIWPLIYLCVLWPQNIMEANMGHLPTKYGLIQTGIWLEIYQP